MKHLGAEGHVGSRAEPAGRQGEERIVRSVAKRPAARGEALGVTAVLLQHDLCLGVQLGRQYQPGDAAHPAVGPEPVHQGAYPTGIEDEIVVGEGTDLAVGFGQPAVASPRQSGHGLAQVPDPAPVPQLDQQVRGVVRGRVVHHDHLDRRIVRPQQGVQAARQQVRPVVRAHDDADQREAGRPGSDGGRDREGAFLNVGVPVGRVDDRPAQPGVVAGHAVGCDQAERAPVPADQRQHPATGVAQCPAAGGAQHVGPVQVQFGHLDGYRRLENDFGHDHWPPVRTCRCCQTLRR